MNFYGNITDEETMRGFRLHFKYTSEPADKHNSQACVLRTRVRKLEWIFHLALDRTIHSRNDETYYWDAARFLISYGKGMAREDVCQAWRKAKRSVDRLLKLYPEFHCDYKSRTSVQEWNQSLL